MAENKSVGAVITEGPILKQLLGFFFPILVGTFFQQLYNTVDMVVVGRFVSTEALSAVGGSAAQIVSTIVSFFVNLSIGSGVIISQMFGARKVLQAKENIQTAYAFALIGSVVITILGLVTMKPALYALKTPEDTIPDSITYMSVYYMGIIFIFVFNMGSAILRALGNSKLPLYYLIVCSLINVALDVLLVAVFRIGVLGVAIATVASQAVSAILVTWKLLTIEEDLRLGFKGMRINRKHLAAQLRIGIPSGLTVLTYAIANMIVQTNVNSFGTVVTAGFGTLAKIDAFFWMVNNAFGVALVTFVGQNFGAGKWDRVRKGTNISLVMHAATSILIGVLFHVFCRQIFMVFTEDTAVIESGISMMSVMIPFYWVFCFVEVYTNTLRGIGNVTMPLIMNLIGITGLRLIWLLFVVPHFRTPETVCMNFSITWTATAVLFIVYYHIYMRNKPRTAIETKA